MTTVTILDYPLLIDKLSYQIRCLEGQSAPNRSNVALEVARFAKFAFEKFLQHVTTSIVARATEKLTSQRIDELYIEANRVNQIINPSSQALLPKRATDEVPTILHISSSYARCSLTPEEGQRQIRQIAFHVAYEIFYLPRNANPVVPDQSYLEERVNAYFQNAQLKREALEATHQSQRKICTASWRITAFSFIAFTITSLVGAHIFSGNLALFLGSFTGISFGASLYEYSQFGKTSQPLEEFIEMRKFRDQYITDIAKVVTGYSKVENDNGVIAKRLIYAMLKPLDDSPRKALCKKAIALKNTTELVELILELSDAHHGTFINEVDYQRSEQDYIHECETAAIIGTKWILEILWGKGYPIVTSK